MSPPDIQKYKTKNGFSHTFPIPFPYLSHGFPILSSYSPHTLLILSSYSPHTLLILSSYSPHTLFILSSYTLHTLLIHSSYTRSTPVLHFRECKLDCVNSFRFDIFFNIIINWWSIKPQFEIGLVHACSIFLIDK